MEVEMVEKHFYYSSSNRVHDSTFILLLFLNYERMQEVFSIFQMLA